MPTRSAASPPRSPAARALDNPRAASPGDSQRGSRLGPSYSADAIRGTLNALGAVYRELPGDEEVVRETAQHLIDQRVVGWFQGRMEFGPRALCGRSILGDARSREMQSLINLKTKFREGFRPFAPVVLRERAHEFFQLKPGQESPYMLLVAPVRPEHRLPVPADDHSVGLDKLKVPRSTLPAITHVDCSARVQTADPVRNGRFVELLREFERRTGCPVLINTSFNVRSEPIVCSPEHAYRCFMASNIDVLVLERFVLLKSEQPAAKEHEIDSYLASFNPD